MLRNTPQFVALLQATMAPPNASLSDIPARLDRLPWSPFHRLVVVALGITWILDGLEVTLAGSVAAALQTSPRLHLTSEQVGLTGSAYLAGAVLGSLYFGHLTDRLGRKKLFNVTLGVYLVATALTAVSWNYESFLFFRFVTGAGIGGEYSAINSAIQELIPARLRGRTDLAINGSFWVGAAVGALVSVLLLDPRLVGPDIGWRLAFGSGAVLGLFILYLRRFLPESPRWLMIHGKPNEAHDVVVEIEQRVVAAIGVELEPAKASLSLGTPHRLTLGSVARTLLKHGRFESVRPALPFLMVATEGLLLLTSPLHPFSAWTLGAYALATGAEAVRVGRKAGLLAVPIVWGIFPVLHVAHGVGFASGLVKYKRAPDWDAPEILTGSATASAAAVANGA